MNSSSLLFLHVVGAILLFSTYIAAFTMRAVAGSGDRAILAYVYRVMNRLDLLVTPVASLLLLGSGFLLASRAGIPIFETGWLAWSLVLFGITGVLFLAFALPLQRRIEHLLANDGDEDGSTDGWRDAYERLSRRWFTVAGTSFILTVTILYLMIHT